MRQFRHIEYVQLYEQGHDEPFCCLRVEDWRRTDFAFWLFVHTGIIVDRWQFCLASRPVRAGEGAGDEPQA